MVCSGDRGRWTRWFLGECLTGDQQRDRRTEDAGEGDRQVRLQEGADQAGQRDAEALDGHQTAGLNGEEATPVRRVDGGEDHRVDAPG